MRAVEVSAAPSPSKAAGQPLAYSAETPAATQLLRIAEIQFLDVVLI
ncbi:hypothetical protein AB0L13_35020 [Saccharopolyspora shandongensis]